jgi:hypothetical protein
VRRADGTTPLVRRPAGQIIRIQQNGRLTAAMIAGQPQAGHRSPVSNQPTKEEMSWHESS